MNTAQTAFPYLTFIHHPGNGETLQDEAGTRTVLSAVCPAPVAFSSLILSVDYTTATSGWLLTEVQVLEQDCWSDFFKLGFYSKKLNHSFEMQESPFGQLHIDELQLTRPAQAYRFRLTLHGDMEVRSVMICVSESSASPVAEYAQLPAGSYRASVHPVSQMCLPVPESERVRLCSPTSLCMALNALGVAADPRETAQAVYDKRAHIFGNWTLNAAYACRQGLQSCVTRFRQLSSLEQYVCPGSLVIASVAYKPGELTNSAVAQTPGHLVLVYGWEPGKVWVADPAAPSPQEVLRAYDAQEFARAWLVNKQGIAYIVRKK